MFKRWRQSHFRRADAQGMVEFALILPLLLLVVFGIIELGRLLVVYSSVGTASREAARYASASGDSASSVPYYMDCAGIRAAAHRMGILVGMQDSDILISYDEGQNPDPSLDPVVISATCPPASENDVQLGDRVVVDVSANYRPLLPLVDLPPFVISSRTARTIVKDVYIEYP